MPVHPLRPPPPKYQQAGPENSPKNNLIFSCPGNTRKRRMDKTARKWRGNGSSAKYQEAAPARFRAADRPGTGAAKIPRGEKNRPI